jgi:O-antigen ligase
VLGNPHKLLPYLLVLAPLAYATDGDNYRTLEVFALGGLMFWVATALPFYGRVLTLHVVIFMYCLLLIAQQPFIARGDVWFGTKNALLMAAAFVPSWIVYSFDWKLVDFSTAWDSALKLLTIIVGINFVGSLVFGFGEVKVGLDGQRAFGFLGDSFSPVLIFPMLYFLFQKKYMWAGLVAVALIATRGKAAFVMLAFALGLYVFLRVNWRMRVLLIVLFGFFLAGVGGLIVRQAIGNDGIKYSLSTRLITYERGWDLFNANPVIGVGINQSMQDAVQSGQALARLANLDSFAVDNQIDNAFLRTMAETGVIGLVLLLALCVLLVRQAISSVQAVRNQPPSKVRALVLASGLWTVSFILTYQTVGWFEAGHPQLAWLLLISSSGYVASRVYAGIAKSPARNRNYAAGGQDVASPI